MADLITRLLLNTQQFDQNLGNSSKQIQGFQQKINTFSSGAIGAFSKLAGGVGLAIGGMEAFNMAISSTQTTGDTFAITIGTAKDSVDVFFRSLVSGDWTPFQNGIATTYANLKEFQLLLDELDDKKLSLGYIKAEDTRDLARFEEIAKDTTRSYEDRINAVQNYEGVVNHLNKRTQETINLEMKALNTRYSAKSGLKIGDSDLKYFVKNTNFSGELTSEASSKYKEYIRLKNEADKLARSAEYDAKQYGYNPSKGVQKEYADKLRVLELYKKENEFLIKQGWLAEEGDEGRKSTFETLKQQLQLEEEIYRQQIKADKLRRTVTKGDSTTSSNSKVSNTVKKAVLKDGSLAAKDAEIAEAKRIFNEELTDNYQRIEQQKKINKLEAERNLMAGAYLTDASNIIGKLEDQKEAITSFIDQISKKEIKTISDTTMLGLYEDQLKDINNQITAIKQNVENLSNVELPVNEVSSNLENIIKTSISKGVYDSPLKSLKDIQDLQNTLSTTSLAAASAEERVKLQELAEMWKEIALWMENGKMNVVEAYDNVVNKKLTYSPKIDTKPALTELNSLATQLNTISSLTGEGAAAWVNWASTVMTSIATALPMIAALTTAKNAEASANAKAAITGAGSSVASIPIVGPLMAVAAVGSIIAAFASIPKFADGGIISGSSFVGDNLIARVNSGEMILNGTQQRNLFNLLDGKGNVAGSSGEVVFKIAGKDLVGTLNNQMSKTNKYK